MTPETVRVHWSESFFFPDEEKDYPFEEFEEVALMAAKKPKRGYDKTLISVLFDDGETFSCRLHLAPEEDLGFRHYMETQAQHIRDNATQGGGEFMKLFTQIEWPEQEKAPQ